MTETPEQLREYLRKLPEWAVPTSLGFRLVAYDPADYAETEVSDCRWKYFWRNENGETAPEPCAGLILLGHCVQLLAERKHWLKPFGVTIHVWTRTKAGNILVAQGPTPLAAAVAALAGMEQKP